MSVVTFDLTGNAFVELDKIMRVLGDTTPVLNIMGRVFKTKIQFCFRDSKDPWGVPWKPIVYRDGKPLIDTRRLLSSITANVTANTLEVGTNVEYGPYHQFGFTRHVEAHTKEVYFMRKRDGSIGNRFVSPSKSNFAQEVFVKAHDIVTPGRPFLPIREGDVIDLPTGWANDAVKAVVRFYEGKL